MIIVAKFMSSCPKCGERIDPGDRVEWTKGSKAIHEACASTTAPGASPVVRPTSKTTSEPGVEAAPYVRYEKWAPCKRGALPQVAGEVRVAGKTQRAWAELRKGASGGPVVEGDALVVVAQTARYESTEDNEDMGDMSGPGWHVTLYLRRATAEEAAPALARAAADRARREARELKTARIRDLAALCRKGTGKAQVDLPEGTQLVIDPGVHGSGRKIAVLSPDGSTVSVWCSGYYDDYVSTLDTTSDPQALEIARCLLGLEGAEEKVAS